MRAAIDCGTNTIRLLIVDDAGARVVRTERIVRLGQDVDATGRFHPDALRRTFAAVDEYADLIDRHRATLVRFGATSAARDAANVTDLAAGVRERLGIDVEVLTGDQEARLGFRGALIGPRVPGPVLVTDIGGGSTELVVGDADGRVHSAVSVEMGAVRLRERFLPSDPPAPAEVAAGRGHVDALLDQTAIDWDGVGTWIGVAGTFTTVAAWHLGLAAYDSDQVTGTQIPGATLRTLSARCLAAETAALVGPVVPRARAEVIAGGVLILDALARRLGDLEVLVRDCDVLDALVLAGSATSTR